MATISRQINFTTVGGKKVDLTFTVTGKYIPAHEVWLSDGYGTITRKAEVEYAYKMTGTAGDVKLEGGWICPAAFERAPEFDAEIGGEAYAIRGYMTRYVLTGITTEQVADLKAWLDGAKDAIIAMDSEIKAFEDAKAAARAEEEIARAERVIEIASKHEPMTAAELKKWRREYNNVHNEGGEGYVPERVSIEETDRARAILAKYGRTA